MDKNLPAIAGDMGSVPELGRSHMLWSNLARAPQLLRSVCHNQRSHSSEKPMQHDREQPSLTRGERRVVWLQWAGRHSRWSTRKPHYLHFTYLRAMEKKKKKFFFKQLPLFWCLFLNRSLLF